MTQKVLCIEDVFGVAQTRDLVIFHEGVSYNMTNQIYLERQIGGFNVEINNGEYYFFNMIMFKQHFKTYKQIRKEKLNKLNAFSTFSGT